MDIKSFKYLKWTKYLTLLYILFCIVSDVLFMLYSYYDSENFFGRTLFLVAFMLSGVLFVEITGGV